MIQIYKKTLLFIILATFFGCQDDDAELGTILPPSNLQIDAVIEDGQTGNVTITPQADDALNFHIFFTQNGDPLVAQPGESQTFRYTQSGQYSVFITVVAFGTGGTSSSQTIELDLDVRLFIDQATLQMIGGDGSKRWIWDSSVGGHFGVGPTTNDFPEFFSASPNQLDPCIYDDVLVFSYDANDNYSFELITGDANQTFMNWAEVTKFFPNDTPTQFVDECRDITDQIATNTSFVIFENEEGTRIISVENSTLSYWSGAMEYQVLELTADKLSVRGIQEVSSDFGGGQLAWYHTFVPEDSGTDDIAEPPFDTLVWADEFDTNGAPNTANWTYDLGTGDNGWGNGESQSYTNDASNVIVEDGLLKITARAENGGYTSARIKTQDLFSFTYGKVDVRAKLPTGGGTWPAIWMLGSNITEVGWPNCGEIDIMEHVGNNQDVVSSALHFPGNNGGNAIFEETNIAGASTDFHVYSVEWSSSEIVFSIDGNPYHTFPYANNLPFYNNDFFMILNVAMGGTFGGAIDPAFTESTMEIDYVRVYQ
ncbi:glycoside hydrolase family 16 protein [Aquimarina sp. AD1]|uniref:glycoside hydrolase family 16 protein n=1 Tax=Aquimarina sp. (strain AD1) TaxID=1714848 RepID=UPI000E52C74D|nr:glycoside hydrolase family 16 protein [Aquimarina sp. AD1]AXT55626.1 glycoside hydrolase family 16 protein [Aquimarina sp. AD1]RKN37458.1 glycosyl hydrolase family protein [Aquimarina sp. AD1]